MGEIKGHEIDDAWSLVERRPDLASRLRRGEKVFVPVHRKLMPPDFGERIVDVAAVLPVVEFSAGYEPVDGAGAWWVTRGNGCVVATEYLPPPPNTGKGEGV